MRARNLSVRRQQSDQLALYEGKNGQALSPRAVFLALMPIGSTRMMALPNVNALSGSLMRTARRINGAAGAKWSGRSTTKGVRVTRLA